MNCIAFSEERQINTNKHSRMSCPKTCKLTITTTTTHTHIHTIHRYVYICSEDDFAVAFVVVGARVVHGASWCCTCYFRFL